MKKTVTSLLFAGVYSLLQTGYLQAQAGADALTLPLGGNSFVTYQPAGSKAAVTDSGWVNWQDARTVFSSYIKVNQPGSLQLSAQLRVPSGETVIRTTIAGTTHEVKVSGAAMQEVPLGTWNIDVPGYIKIDVQGKSSTGAEIARMLQWRMAGTTVNTQTVYVKNNEGNYFHWGRRGPSVHLGYDISEAGGNVEWFYNEITVPQGSDPVGSYFMADGFGEGYFGMQVNSAKERRVLFSVWSPFKTDDPKSIPADQKIRLLKRGSDVHAGEFGNEGSGGQSYLRYNWRAGNTYRFLLHALPGDSDRTTYTAYFFAPELNQWQLIASFSRPHTQAWLTHLHSFLENFEPETGYITRKALYHNQWIKTSNGDWKPLHKARFTGDATAQKAYRTDYDGGAEGNAFFLHNCGFFSNNATLNTSYSIAGGSEAPGVDLNHLP